MATQKYLNHIAGEWVEGASSSRDINPSDTKDVVAEYTQADKAQTETAIDAVALQPRAGQILACRRGQTFLTK